MSASIGGMKIEKTVETINFEPSKFTHINFNLAVFCFWFSIYIYVPLFSVYLEDIGFSYAAIGMILGGYGVTQILFRLPLGILSDVLHHVRKQLFIAGFVCSFISAIILVYFDGFVLVLIARLLAGITAAMWVMATVMYSYYFKPDKAARAMGAMQFNTVATQFICMAISGYIIASFGWNAPFWLGAVASVLGIIFVLNIKEVKIEVPNQAALSVKEYLTNTHAIKGIKTITFLSLVAHAILFITIFGFSPIISVSIGISESEFIWLMSAFFIPHALISLLLMTFHLNPTYNRILLIMSFIFSALFIYLISTANTLWTMSAYHAGLGLSLGFIFPILLSEVVKISPAELKMSAMGYYQSFYAFGILLGPILAGYVAEAVGLQGMFVITAILTLFSVLVLVFHRKKTIQ